jgi:hypothetical protein
MEPMRSLLVFIVIAVCTAQAQDAAHAYKRSVLDYVALPGDFASTSGNVSSYEQGNVVTDNYFEQRAVVFSTWHNSLTITPYMGTEFLLDTSGYNWNNKVMPGVGVRLNKHLHDGVVSAGVGYLYEYRFRNVEEFKPTAGRTDYVTDWFGWNDASDRRNRFPGSTWGIVGHYSPVERGNLIERGHVQQGFVVKRVGSKALVPYAEGTIGHDSQKLNWENLVIFGAGVKAIIPAGDKYTEFGCGYLREDRFVQHRTASGVKVFLNFYYGWSLFGRKGS